jgi:hypothetical protein
MSITAQNSKKSSNTNKSIQEEILENEIENLSEEDSKKVQEILELPDEMLKK